MALDLGGLLSGYGKQEPTQNALNRKAQVAQMLMQGSTGTVNPLVAALGSFLGTSELMNIADQQGKLDMSEMRRAEEERKRKIANEERSFGLEERKLDMTADQFAKEFGLKKSEFGLKQKELGLQAQKLNAEINKLNKEAERGGLDPKDIIKIENDLRDDYVKQSGEFIKQRDAFGRITASAKDPSPAGDLALIFNYMKLLDPGSTVREGEFANAQNAGNISQSIVGQYNKLIKGEGRLDETLRNDFLNRANRLYKQAEGQQGQTTKTYQGLASRAVGVNPENVVIPLGAVIQEEAVKPISEMTDAELEAIANGK